jgi:non-heme chloroperoxidase
VLHLHDVTVVGHSTGGVEVAFHFGRHGTSRTARAVQISAARSSLVKSEANPDGQPIETFDDLLADMLTHQDQVNSDLLAFWHSYSRPQHERDIHHEDRRHRRERAHRLEARQQAP